ncbi:MAG: YkvA family protein [Myxococcota bacterium]|nr:YkvA family protein [Myxococcota bacterium]
MTAKTKTVRQFKVSFELDESDVAYFRRLFRVARRAARDRDPQEILDAAHEMVTKVRATKKAPHFIVEAVDAIDDLTAIVTDRDYNPPKSVKKQVLGALAYFANPDDLIPDHVPVFGFLDDALMIAIVEEQFKHELWGFRKFRKQRYGLEHRPWTNVARARLPKRLAEIRKKIRVEIGARRARDEARGRPGF